jgi:transposase
MPADHPAHQARPARRLTTIHPAYRLYPHPAARTRSPPQATRPRDERQAYSSKGNRAYLRRHRIQAVIPVKGDQKTNRLKRGSAGGRPPNFDAERYKEPNTVERCFNKLRQFRAVATRFDKRDQGTIDVASIKIWLRDPVP